MSNYDCSIPLSIEAIKILDEFCKFTKSTSVAVNTVDDKVYLDGIWGEPMQAIKKLGVDDTPATARLAELLCYNVTSFILSSSIIASILKQANEFGERGFFFRGFRGPGGIHIREIGTPVENIPIEQPYTFLTKLRGTLAEFHMDTTLISSHDLTADPEFMDIMSLKAAQGGRFYNIGNTPVMISPSMFKLNKGDTMEARVYQTLDLFTRMILFTIHKKKQTIEVLIKVRVL